MISELFTLFLFVIRLAFDRMIFNGNIAFSIIVLPTKKTVLQIFNFFFFRKTFRISSGFHLRTC